MMKIRIKKETAYYRDGIYEGFFVRYWDHGPIFNVYKTMGDAFKYMKVCHEIKMRNYTLAGKIK